MSVTDTIEVVEVAGESGITVVEVRLGVPGPQGIQGIQGVPGINWQGVWSGATAYVVDDAVSYNGSSWIALRSNTNVAPVEGLDWTIVAAKGDQGIQGIQGPQGIQGIQGNQGIQGPIGDPGTIEMFPFGAASTLLVRAGVARFYLTESYNLESVVASVGTAPTGAAIIVDINKNGASVFANPANRPTIPIAGFTSGEVTDAEAFVPGDYITVDIDQVGSVVAGADLTVVVRLTRTS